MYMPVPAMIQAMTAPNGPVALAKVRGSEKMPAPTMPPTTIAVRANSESFCVCSGAIESPPRMLFQNRQPSLSAAPTCMAP